MENNPLIEARNITVEIASKKLLGDISLDLPCGEILAVLGPNGAGKSTLRKVLSWDITPKIGAVSMNGRPLIEISLPERARMRAVLPQDSSLDFPFSVFEVVLMGRSPHIRGTESIKDYEIVKKALDSVEESSLEKRIYPTLSGGERQRVQLARVLAQIWENTGEPRYLLLDEPTANLDIAHQHQALKLAQKFADEGVGVLVILHDLNLAAQYADKILLLNRGKMVAFGTAKDVLTNEIIGSIFGVRVEVMDHPFLNCPLVVWKGDPG